MTNDFAIKVPFTNRRPFPASKPAVIIHVFYVELFPEMIDLLVRGVESFALFISTDTDEKKAQLETILLDRGVRDYQIRVLPNRGRDIAPKIVGFADIHDDYDIVLHLHTKRSPHGESLAGWRSYLLNNLIGSRAIVESNLSMLASSNIGMVFPQHYSVVWSQLNWGYDYPLASQLLERMGYRLSKDALLEFPSGSMFWARTDALRPLLDLNLGYDDFDEEAGQIDGTLAHAIERSYLYVVEQAGFRWVKVCDGADSLPQDHLVDLDKIGMDAAISTVHRPLFEEHGREQLLLARANGELRPLRLRQSLNPAPRLNLLLPTLIPSQVFGGIATALRLFDQVADQASVDRRIVVLDSPMTEDSWSSVPTYVRDGGRPQPSAARSVVRTVAPMFHRSENVLDVRKNDVFFSTAWWSEYLRQDIDDFQAKLFGRAPKGVYLVQDYESGFMQWSSKWGIAESTYTFRNCIQIVNSEELYNFFKAKGCLTETFVLPYEINRTIRDAIAPKAKERLLLCYGRPTATRNCFEIIVDGISLWQQRHPHIAVKWSILFLGETFPEGNLYPVQNATVIGKASLLDYADLLSRASAGISLMISPHPSYPPLEMAHAGLQVISNNYATKKMSLRSPRITELDEITPRTLAAALEEVIARAEADIGKTGTIGPVNGIEFDAPRYDAKAIANLLMSPLR